MGISDDIAKGLEVEVRADRDTVRRLARTAATQAVHLIMAVTWPGSIGTNPGSGNVHVWTRAKLTFGAGNTITSVNTPCGSVVPDIQTTTIAGGKKVQPEFLPAVWDQLTDPREFVEALWHKADMTGRAWPAGISLWRSSATKAVGPSPRAPLASRDTARSTPSP